MRSIIIAALFGLISADDTHAVWELRSVKDHAVDSGLTQHFGDHATKQANARPPMRSHGTNHVVPIGTLMQMMDISDSEDSSDSEEENLQVRGDDIPAWQSGREVDGYKRVATAHFSADTDDLFMRSMIMNYSVEATTCEDEEKKENCKPNGQFWMTKADTRRAASEVLATHKGLKGDALKTYLNTYFDKAWSHFDVNRTGKVEVIKMPQFMRFLASDQQLQLGESL